MTTRASLRRWVSSPAGILLLLASTYGCQGNGCSCMTPIPGGFPSADRTANEAQVRVSSTGVTAITADPEALVGALVGSGGLSFNVPADCAGSTPVCCPGGNPQTPCGPVDIDLAAQPGDTARLEIAPAQGASRIDVTVRARVKTEMDIPVNIFGGDCGIAIDTAPGPDPDIELVAPVNLVQDATAGTTRIDVGTVAVNQLTTDDVTINGSDFRCIIGNVGLGLFLGTLQSTFAGAIQSAIQDQACKACPSGDVAECGEFATSCDNNVCMEGDVCLQELGVTGRMAGSAVFGSFSPGTTGSIDLYEVAGGYATTNNGGIALGLLGGMQPAGAPRDRCGPPATAPAPVTIPQSTFFQGNTRPDTNAPFDVAIGVHQDQLDQFAYAAYDGGLLCLTVGTRTVGLINSDTFSLFLRSLPNLTSGDVVPMAIGIRPQSPPTITLGKNTFVDDGNGGQTLQEPLLDINFTGLEMDIFADVEGQYVRLFTLVSDLHLPVGLQVGAMGELTPVLGDLTGAFTNISVKNSDPMIETPDELAAVFPMILQLALPSLSSSLGSFQVPTLAGLQINVTDITSVDSDTFLAIFGSLAPASMPRTRVDTTVDVTGVTVPPTYVFADARSWSPATRPRVDLALGGSEPGLEWQVRLDDGLWSAWSRAPARALSTDLMWLQGKHKVQVRARRRGQPLSADLTPAEATIDIDTIAPVPRLEQVGDTVRIDGHDAVSGDTVTVRWRMKGGAWREAPAPVDVDLAGRAPSDLEIQVVDEAGNVAPTRGSLAVGVSYFHGQPGSGGGCNCSAGGEGGGTGAGALALLVGLGLVVGGRRRRRWRGARGALRAAWRSVRRGAGRWLGALAVIVVGGALQGCSCSHNPCGSKACEPGEVAQGAIGRWNSIATDGTRTVVTTYDQILGDLVLAEPQAGGDPVYTVIDGVPDDTATYDPSTYRGGIVDPGPDVGAWTSVALVAGKVAVAYQDRDRHALRYAVETSDGSYKLMDVDVPVDAERIGQYASLAMPAEGPAIAYIATGVANTDGTRQTELRVARSTSNNPAGPGDWSVTVVATGLSGCAGLCGSDKCVESATAGDPETCATPTSDCDPACGSGDVCVAGACLTEDTNEILDLPGGVGMYANLLVTTDGRLVVVAYDQVQRSLVAEVENGAGTGTYTEVVLDGGDAVGDRGEWASAVLDGSGTIHVAYQDALGDQLYYTTLAGNTVGTPELVDDGVRSGDRTHTIGAGATMYFQAGTPTIAYQDGTSSDLVMASKGASGWSHTDLATGPLLDGFHIAAPPDGGWLVWDSIDKDKTPVSGLVIQAMP
jgi:MYXO-CTERM domain-containing protein